MMLMRSFLSISVCVGTLFAATPAVAQTFFEKFMKPEYIVPVGDFPPSSGGDYHLTYYQVQLPRFTAGEVLILGEYPRARYFSITAYDDHGAVLGKIDDTDIQPLAASANPFVIGGPAGAEDQLYAVTVRLGEGLATSPAPQCATPFDVHANMLDARTRHTAGTFYSAEQSGFSANVPGYGTVVHDDSTANGSVFLLIRAYIRQSQAPGSQFDLRKPLVWIRASNNGCAAQLAPVGQFLPQSQWFSLTSILALDQVYAHMQHEINLGTTAPHGPDPLGETQWFGREEYLPGQAVGRYLSTVLPLTPGTLNAEGRVLQMKFRLPQLACPGNITCSLTGDEQLRYWSLTFETAAGASLASMSEFSVVPDQNGYVTAALSFGTPLPAHVTPANGYTPIMLPAGFPVARLVLRNYLPRASFECSTENVAPRTAEHHPNGGAMGEYLPLITFPAASSLPPTATPLNHGGSCTFP